MKAKATPIWRWFAMALGCAWEDRTVIGWRWPQALWLCVKFATGFRVRIVGSIDPFSGFIDFTKMAAGRKS